MSRQEARSVEAGRQLVLRVPPLIRYISLPVAAAGISHLLSATIGFIEGDHIYSIELMLWAIIYLASSVAWMTILQPSRSLSKEETLILVGFSWLTTPLLSAIPVSYALGVPLIDAWFESVSGFTTTGLSVFNGAVDPDYNVYIPSVEELPLSILWWRAVTEWLGGFGIVVMFYVFARLGGLPAHLVGFAEGRFERLEPSIAKSIQALMALYLFLTITGAILLYIAGMTPADAVYHSMTGIATGGFSTHSESVGFYNSVIVEAAAIIVMALGAANFADLYALVKGIPRRFSREIESFIAVALLSIFVGTAILYITGWTLYHPLREAAFDVVTALSGTGFGISDLSKAPEAWKAFLVPLMLIGGSAFSTTGGIKQYRLMVLAKNIVWMVTETVYGTGRITVRRVGGYAITESELRRVMTIVTLFTLTHMGGTLALMLLIPGCSLADAAFEAASALGTVGLSVGITSAAATWQVKAVLMVLMTLGRLEIAGFLYTLAAAAKMTKRVRIEERRKPGMLRFKERRTYLGPSLHA
ncbi:Trk-type K+ transport system, membrane component [Pyrodictium delaneyi]|uniref:Trk-type K+ transport system, membrane component n=1 Tax=Pyrodictium delaneyi TaxID=1273541 RepID=A0A0P0N127_9CREN|nr:TrkH family potassium uptake protein [Pyrodictium delaneyi]ALL00234.1 Trk-type K+ transport system, membrane component [Pyrodictium delaneyi]OWJ54317.1 hypothetical protein Pdsh_07475 [Pyrodictium delaneyi]